MPDAIVNANKSHAVQPLYLNHKMSHLLINSLHFQSVPVLSYITIMRRK